MGGDFAKAVAPIGDDEKFKSNNSKKIKLTLEVIIKISIALSGKCLHISTFHMESKMYSG